MSCPIATTTGPKQPRRFRGCIALMALVVCINGTSELPAGGGPENVLLVVNPLRSDSLTLANHYAALRQIPSSNIYNLDWKGSTESMTIDTFRKQFLEPMFAEIDRRRLQRQIDYIVYSTGFPYAIDFSGDFNGPPERMAGRRGSLTGLTYLSQWVRLRDTSYAFTATNLQNNFYYGTQTRGFSSLHGWTTAGQRVPTGGRGYYLSTMLGYTDGRGNSVEEAVNYLRRSTMADGTRPAGTIYLMKVNGEIRSATRHDTFPQVVALLQQAGVKAEIVEGVLPTGRQDVMGIMTGRATLYLDRVKIKILPGAICEHLTSFGGDLREKASQTPLSEFLRHGAAGASGAVTEPFAIQAKFPHPIMHVHYARGLSLAEAFYHSIASPYQMLIVGDPLCRPWARIPQIAVEGVQANQTVQAMLTVIPRSETLPVKLFRLFVDGRLIQGCKPGELFEIDTTKVGDGYHELRIVGIEDSPAETQGRLIIPIYVNNRGKKIDAAVQPRVVDAYGRLQCLVSAPGSRSIYVFHNRTPLGQIKGGQGTVAIDARKLGRGPVVLTAVGLGARKSDKVFSPPILLTVEEPIAVHGSPLEGR